MIANFLLKIYNKNTEFNILFFFFKKLNDFFSFCLIVFFVVVGENSNFLCFVLVFKKLFDCSFD